MWIRLFGLNCYVHSSSTFFGPLITSFSQVLSLLIKETIGSNVVVNFETEGKTYSGSPTKTPRHMCHLDGYVVVRNSELLCGTFDKKSIGSGTKDNLFHVLLRDFSPEVFFSFFLSLII